MTQPLSFIQQFLDRSIFHQIDRVMTVHGYAPDRSSFDLTNQNGKTAYRAALKAITDSQDEKFGIDLFGHSNTQFKGNKKTPRIVIVPYGFLPGDIGLDLTPQPLSNNGVIHNHTFPTQSSEYEVNIHVTGSSAIHMVILNAILSQAMSRRGYIPFWPTLELKTSGNIFYENIGSFDSTDRQEGVLEKVYRYILPDVYETECSVDEDNQIALIQEITLQLALQDLITLDEMVISNA